MPACLPHGPSLSCYGPLTLLARARLEDTGSEKFRAGHGISKKEAFKTISWTLVLGVVPADTGSHNDPGDPGLIKFNEDFDLGDPASQAWLTETLLQTSKLRSIAPISMSGNRRRQNWWDTFPPRRHVITATCYTYSCPQIDTCRL